MRLFETNFDVRFVNEEMLDQLVGEVYVFKGRQKTSHFPSWVEYPCVRKAVRKVRK